MAQETNTARVAIPTGNQACTTCHVASEAHKVNVHHSDCNACHTLTNPNHLIQGGTDNVKFPDAGKCLGCHKSNDHKRMNWAFSEHKKANVECRDCHGMHSPKRPKEGVRNFV